MTASTIQDSFNAGEISPELYGEVSLKKFSSAATTLRNMIPSYRGGALSRGGLAYVGRCKQGVAGTGPPRPIPFSFSITQSYVLEFGDHYLRFVFQGGYVLETGFAITGASQADPCVINVAGTPFSNGDWVFISGVVGMFQLNRQTYIVAGVAGGHFSLHDLNGAPLDATAYAAYVSGGTVSRVYTVASPYLAVDLPYLKYSQTADVMSLTCSNPITGNEYAPYDLTRLAGADWTLVQTDFNARIAAPTSISAVANAQAPTNGVNATFRYRVTAVDKDGNESVASGPAGCHGADLEVEGGTNTVTWAMVAKARYYNVYRSSASVDTSGVGPNPVPGGSILGFVGSSFGTQFIDSRSVVDLTQTPPLHGDPFAQGQILAVDISSGGSGLSAVTYAITTAAGVNFAGDAIITGGALAAFPIRNGGEGYLAGDSIAFNGAGFATGAIAFPGNPTAGDTITLNGIVWTFVAALTGGRQTKIQGALSATLASLVQGLSAATSPSLTVASYDVDLTNTNLVVTYDTAGTAGNAYTLAASVGTPSGATLTGGSGFGGPGVPTATLEIGPSSGTYPGVNVYFQQRHFFANSLNDPDTFWTSQTGLFTNMDVSIPTIATDAITATPWTEQVNGIQWLVPMAGGLIAMTGSRAWQLLGEGSYQLNSQPMTPATTQAQPQAFNGASATVPPIVVDNDVLFVEALSGVVRDLAWNFYVNIYTGADLTILSSHLFLYRQIVQWAWARNPYKVFWAACDDGAMLSLTYLKEQEVYGWARHDTQGLVVGMTSVSEPPVNALYAVVQRFPPYAPSGVYQMERMDNRLWQSVEDAYAVDSGVANPFTVAPAVPVQASAASGAGITFTATGAFTAGEVGQDLRMAGGIARIDAFVSADKVTGHWVLGANVGAAGFPYAAAGQWSIAAPINAVTAPHLAGMTGLVGLADGVPLSGLSADPATGHIALGVTASNVKVGLPFLAQMQTPYLNGQQVVQGARKVINAATLRLAASGKCQYGTNQPDGGAQNPQQIGPAWSNLSDIDPLQPTGGQAPAQSYVSPGGLAVTQLWTGDIRAVGNGADWDSKGQVAVQQALPLPLEVTAVLPEVLPGDLPEQGYSPEREPGNQQPRPPGRWMIRGRGQI